MDESVGPGYARFIEELRLARRLPPPERVAAEGQVMQPVVLDSRRANELIREVTNLVTLEPDTLETLVLTNANSALRSVRIVS